MIDGLKPYPAIKVSGVPWLGDVPEHWEVLPALAVFKPRQVKNTGMIESTVLSLSYGRIIVKPTEKLRRLVPESFETYQVVDPGNIIVRTTDLQNDQTSLRIGHSQHRGIITSAYLCLETMPRVSNKFGYQYLNAYDLLKIIYGFGSGLRQNLDFSDIKRMPVLVPPLPEQAAIVRFLDHADRKIRRYIRAKQRLIKLLEEQKQVIIHRAVTRGLNPNVRLKPSGVEWLGDVPEHWRIVRNMALFAHRVEHGVANLPVLQVSLRSGITVEDLDQFGRPKRLIADPTKYKRIYKGDIAYNTMRMWQGAVGVSPSDGLVSPAYVVLSPRVGTSPSFYDLVFHTEIYKQQVNRQSTGIVSDRNRLYWETFKQMVNISLPRSEQEAILAFIRSETCDLNATSSRLEREIGLLREYRTRLIADVVTGKLDVREAAAGLPEDVEPLDTEDPGDEIEDPEPEEDEGSELP
jgi:type I restriction enzyme S subunit